MDQDDLAALRTRAQSLYAAGDHHEAEQCWTRAAEAGDVDSSEILGWICLERGDLVAARRWLEPAAETGNLEAIASLGLVHLRLGDLESARQRLEYAASKGITPAMTNLADLLSRAGDVQGARSWLERAAESGQVEAIARLGELEWASGQSRIAVDWYQRARTLGYPSAELAISAITDPVGTLQGRLNDMDERQILHTLSSTEMQYVHERTSQDPDVIKRAIDRLGADSLEKLTSTSPVIALTYGSHRLTSEVRLDLMASEQVESHHQREDFSTSGALGVAVCTLVAGLDDTSLSQLALRSPAIALVHAAERLTDEDFLAACAEVPWVALLHAQNRMGDDQFADLAVEEPGAALAAACGLMDGGRLLANHQLLWQVLTAANFEVYSDAMRLICLFRSQFQDAELLRAMELLVQGDQWGDFSFDEALRSVTNPESTTWTAEEAERLLGLLARSADPSLRSVIASLEYLDEDILGHLSVDPDEVVRQAVYENPQATETMRIQAAILGVQTD